MAWTLTNVGDGKIVDSKPFGFYTVAEGTDVHHIAVVPGATYQLTVLDEFQDGFQGNIKLFYGKVDILGGAAADLIVNIAGFPLDTHSVTFTVRLPS